MSFSNKPSSRRASVEAARLLALRSLQLLDTVPERAFDDIVGVAAAICAAPIALVTLVDADRQWFKARLGVAFEQTARDVSFCSIAIEEPGTIFEIADTREDPRFSGNPTVVGPPFYRFYAGVPLLVGGVAIGTLCVLDTVPRTLTAEQRESLVALARGAAATIEYRHAALALTQADRHLDSSEKDEAVFAAAVAHAQDAILILGYDDAGEPRRVTYVNAAFSKMLGRDFSKIVGRSIGEIANQRANQEAIDRIHKTAKHGSSEPVALRVRIGNGDLLDLEMTVSALPKQSIDARLIVVLRNVTARRAALDATARERSENRLATLFSRASAITYTLDRELRFRSSTGGGLNSIGMLPEQIRGMSLAEFLERSPDSAQSLAAHARGLQGESVTLEFEVTGRRFKVYLEPARGDDGAIDGVGALALDVTDFFAKSRALEETEAHVARAERAAQTGSWLHDLATNRLTYSEESQRMFAIEARASDREAFYRRILPEDRDRVRASVRIAYETGTTATFEYRIVATDAVRFIRESVEVSRDALGRPVRADGIFVDITERRLAELDAFRIAYTDDVTGLPNRSALLSYLDRELTDASTAASTFVTINIDRFRISNEALGREAGDRLLRSVGARIRATVPDAYVARLENDLFIVLLGTENDVASTTLRLHAAFAARFEVADSDIDLTVSIGVAPIEADDSAQAVMYKAEVAVRYARVAGGDRTVKFSRELEALRNRRLALERDLFKAVERNEFELNYQPIFDGTGAIVAVEALLRWNHPTFGRVAPDEFIAIAEDNGTIVPIGRWVLRTACREVRSIRSKSRVALRLAVNISAKQFSDERLQAAIEEALELANLGPDALEVEITETTIAQDPAQASRVLADLRLAGVKVSVDDFGTGYSSLASLRRFPLDHLWISRSVLDLQYSWPDKRIDGINNK